jgi:hypothetical protein
MAPTHRPFRLLALAACAGVVSPACGVEDAAAPPAVETDTSSIIGGDFVSRAQERSMGLVNVNNICSGSLFNRDWVITATHCLNLSHAGGNYAIAPRPTSGTEQRAALIVEQVGPTDVAIMQLAPTGAGTEWPNVNRSIGTTPASQLVGQAMSCYGRGATAYANPGPGVTGGGVWQSLTKTIGSIDQGVLITYSNAAGSQTAAPGDSGGGCFMNNQTVAVGSWSIQECSNPAACDATITKITSSGWRSTSAFANYISQAPFRFASANFRQLGTSSTEGPNLDWHLRNGWLNHPFETTDAQIAQIAGGSVQLRGAIKTNGSDPVPFVVPPGMTPSAEVYVPINLCDASKGRLRIYPSGTVVVEAEGGAWANAQCFTSLEGASYAVNNTGYTNLPLVNGWFNSPYNTRPAAAKVTNWVVRLQGAIAGGSNATPFTMPPELRPHNTVYLPVDLCNAAKGRLLIQPSGAVTIQTFGSFGDARCFTSLEGLTYQIDTFGYTPLTLQSGWTNYGSGTRNAGVKNDGGIIRFQGAIRNGSTGVAFTIPSNMAPATNVYVPVDLCLSAKGRLLIQPNGAVSVQTVDNGFAAAQCFTSLEGASFGL